MNLKGNNSKKEQQRIRAIPATKFSKCNKLSFKDENAAREFINRLKKTASGAKAIKATRAYLCPDCQNWHTTSQQDHKNAEIKKLKAFISTQNTLIKLLQKKIEILQKQEAQWKPVPYVITPLP
jgi:hypothetical protein